MPSLVERRQRVILARFQRLLRPQPGGVNEFAHLADGSQTQGQHFLPTFSKPFLRAGGSHDLSPLLDRAIDICGLGSDAQDGIVDPTRRVESSMTNCTANRVRPRPVQTSTVKKSVAARISQCVSPSAPSACVILSSIFGRNESNGTGFLQVNSYADDQRGA